MENPKNSKSKKKSKKPEGQRRTPAAAQEDERFSQVYQNPVFRRVPKNKKRIDIDSRFGGMFHGENFKLKYKVDKRGKPMNLSTDENMKRYYNLIENESSDDEKDKVDIKEEEIKEELAKEDDLTAAEGACIKDEDDELDDSSTHGDITIKEEDGEPNESIPKLSEKIKKKLQDSDIDYARGEGILNSDSDSESDSDSSSSAEDGSTSNGEEELEDMSHAWGELDRDAPRTEEITNRLALCNMDWDRIKSEDLMILFSSFLPPGGVLKYIAIYTSEYGKKRLAEEDVYGPEELREYNTENEGLAGSVPNNSYSDEDQPSDGDDDGGILNDFDEEEEEGSAFHMERLRKYQLNRLKYFYAVMEFDSNETANKIYTECDGLEFESSATRVDLRFIPADVTFDEEPKDNCDALPSAQKYIPKFFTTTALQQMKVDLTWDETDPQRKQLTQRIYDTKENVDDDDVRAYLASSSEDEDTGIGRDDMADSEGDSDEETNPKANSINKYRNLLESLQADEKKKKEKDIEMEITWGVGLKKTTQNLVKKKLQEDNVKKMTPWEEMLAKKQDKKHEKRKLNKVNANATESDKSEEDAVGDGQLFSDDDVDVDLNDPFFKDELQSTGNKKPKSSSKSAKSKTDVLKSKGSKASEEKLENAAALELLLMDNGEGDEKSHFSLKQILEDENAADDTKSKKKRKRNKRKLNKEPTEQNSTKDTFQIDLSDDRFNSLYTSHMFNLDPSNPNYKNTKSMSAIISEKQNRRLQLSKLEPPSASDSQEKSIPINSEDIERAEVSEILSIPSKIARKSEIASLVKSIKRNAQNMKQKKIFGKTKH